MKKILISLGIIICLTVVAITAYFVVKEKQWQEFLDSTKTMSQEELQVSCIEREITCLFSTEHNETVAEGKQISSNLETMEFVYSLGDYPIERFSARWGAVGDVILYSFKKWKVSGGYNFEPMFAKVKDKIQSYDIASYTQESIAAGCTSSYPLFCSPYDIIKSMENVGFDIANTANNHSLDQGHLGIEKSLNNFDNYNIVPVGTYKQSDTASNPVIYEKNGIKFGLLSYATALNGLVMSPDLTYTISMYSEEELSKDIEYLNNNDVDFIICFMHWGDEYTNEPNEQQKAIAQHLTNNKVHVVLGSHSHSLNPIDYLKSANDDHQSIVVYSMGNFQADQHSYIFDTAYGGILELNFVKEVKNNKLYSKSVVVENFYPTFNKTYKLNLIIVPLADSAYSNQMSKKCGIITMYQDINCGN